MCTLQVHTHDRDRDKTVFNKCSQFEVIILPSDSLLFIHWQALGTDQNSPKIFQMCQVHLLLMNCSSFSSLILDHGPEPGGQHFACPRFNFRFFHLISPLTIHDLVAMTQDSGSLTLSHNLIYCYTVCCIIGVVVIYTCQNKEENEMWEVGVTRSNTFGLLHLKRAPL
jgi:hypothetical protein